MISTVVNGMVTLMMARFFLNDLPHAANLTKTVISEKDEVCSDFWSFWATHGGPAPEVKTAITSIVRGEPIPDDVIEFFSHIPIPPDKMTQCVLAEKRGLLLYFLEQ